jgi:hypothetical protein
LPVKVHEEVAGLLGGPFAGWMQGDSQDADAPGGVLDRGEDSVESGLSRLPISAGPGMDDHQ